ncbi:MAG TPA: IS3 family transposase [Pseudobdellovibrionaceae bacterium]|jgi:transposase InsO family protein
MGRLPFNRWKYDIFDKRNGPLSVPANKLTEDEVAEIIKISTSKKYMDLSPCQIVPSLADSGFYVASESSFYKTLKEHNLLSHRGKAKPRNNNRPAPLVATGPNQIFSWDITYLRSSVTGMFYYLYMFMDIYSRKIMGFKVHECESMNYSANLISEICLKEKIQKHKLILHSDNGGAMKGATMLATLQKLGVVPSFSRPRVSDDNPYSEALFKTLKYCPEYPAKPFSSIKDAADWVEKFVYWYNNDHLHSGIKYVTPALKHDGRDIEILENRKKVYREAKIKNPNRWSKEIRNWNRVEKVYLNYLQEENDVVINCAS